MPPIFKVLILKRLNWLLMILVVLCLAMVPLLGCGANSELQALQDKNAALLEENTRLKAEYESLQTEHTALMKENARLKAELEQLPAALTQIEEAYATLEKEYAAIEVQLTEMKKVCPPKHFANLTELKNWLDKRLPELSHYGPDGNWELQALAFDDGYIWSVSSGPPNPTTSYCVAGHRVYWVHLDGFIEFVDYYAKPE